MRKKANSVIKDVLDCSHLEFYGLHKFESNINGNLIFRARKGKLHIVYGVDKGMRIVFLTAIRNFTQYKKFLDTKKEIVRMIAHATRIKRLRGGRLGGSRCLVDEHIHWTMTSLLF